MGKIQLKNSFIFHLNIKYLVGLNMFENLKLQPEDKIMALMSLFKADERKEKIDLGVGVYKNNNGQTPIMSAVQKAAIILNDTQKQKVT